MSFALDEISNAEEAQIKALPYSRLKLGKREDITSYAKQLIRVFEHDYPNLVLEPNFWTVTYPGTGIHEVPNSISYVASLVANHFGIDHFALIKSDRSPRSYDITRADERELARDILLPKDAPSLLSNRRVILLDDCIAGGSTLAKSRLILAPHVASLTTYVLLDLRPAQDVVLESFINRLALQQNNIECLAELWNTESNFTTSKLVRYTYEARILGLVAELRKVAVFNIYLASILYFGADMPIQFDDIVIELKNRYELPVVDKQGFLDALSSRGRMQNGRRVLLLDWLKTRLYRFPGFRVSPAGISGMVSGLNQMIAAFENMPDD